MRTRPVRDRGTWISYAQFTAWAWFLYGLGATIALLRDEQGTTRAVSSLHGSLLAVGGLLGALMSTALVARWGRGPVMRVAAIGAAVGIGIYSLPGASPPVTLLGAFVAGLAAGGILIVSVNAYVMEHQGAAGPAALTEANAMASIAGLMAPVVIGLGAASALGWRAGIALAALAFVAIEVWRGVHVLAYGAPRGAEHHASGGRLPARAYWAIAALVCFMATEFSMTLWSADLLRERLGFAPSSAAVSLSLITGGMLVGRLLGARLAQRRSTESLLRTATVAALLGFGLAWGVTWTPAVLLGLFVVGVGLSLQFPLGMARIIRASGGRADRASAVGSAWGSVGVALAPFALGAASEAVGLHSAFLIVPALLVTSLVILVVQQVPDEVSAGREAAARE